MSPSSSSAIRSTTGALSWYTPAGRNMLLSRHHKPSSILSTLTSQLKVIAGSGLLLAVMLVVLRFWKLQQHWQQFSLENGDADDVAKLMTKCWWAFKSAMHQIKSHLLSPLDMERRRSATHLPTASGVVANGHDSVLYGNHSNETNTHYQNNFAHFTNNKDNIDQILHYWFGRFTVAEAQRQLWMTSQGSARQALVDAEIDNLFGRLLVDDNVDEWSTHALYGAAGKVAAIVLLDQMGRHVLRFWQQQDGNHDPLRRALPLQMELDARALRIAQQLLRQHADEIRSGMLATPMLVFGLMPLRHACEVATLQTVQQQVERLARVQHDTNSLIARFRSATNRRLAILQDEARRTGNSDNAADGTTESSSDTDDLSDDQILDCAPFDADLSLAPDHDVYRTISRFLKDRQVDPTVPTPIIVSLSGGVDSMVIASVLAHMVRCGLYQLHLSAVHIDYANRPESMAEARFVERYSDKLGITCLVRRIDEVTRGVTQRDAYEKISRTIRYDMYKAAAATMRAGGEPMAEPVVGDGDRTVGVMLGHHRGDLRENVLSNAHTGCGPLDLSGMTAVSKNNGVTLYRPLLPLEKEAIFDYAHTFGVPHFKDTTPHWSTRGKLRNKLLPLLQEIYGDGSIHNLSNLALESDECRELLYDVSLRPFTNQLRHKPMGIIFEASQWKDQKLSFWKFVLREALHSGGVGMWTEKSILSFLERVRAVKIRAGWLQCRRDYCVYLRDDGRVYVLFPSSFPSRPADQYETAGLSVGFGRNEARVVGPWRITVNVLRARHSLLKPDDVQTRLQAKAIESMDDLMEGSLEYYLQVPTWRTELGTFQARALVFTTFTKATRPVAWKSIDPKIQECLPLLGLDVKAFDALHDPGPHGATHFDNDRQAEVPNPVYLVKVTLRLVANNPSTSP